MTRRCRHGGGERPQLRLAQEPGSAPRSGADHCSQLRRRREIEARRVGRRGKPRHRLVRERREVHVLVYRIVVKRARSPESVITGRNSRGRKRLLIGTRAAPISAPASSNSITSGQFGISTPTRSPRVTPSARSSLAPRSRWPADPGSCAGARRRSVRRRQNCAQRHRESAGSRSRPWRDSPTATHSVATAIGWLGIGRSQRTPA